MVGMVRITRLTYSAATRQWKLGYQTDGDETFQHLLAIIRELPSYSRVWAPAEKCWVISDLSIDQLVARWPTIDLRRMVADVRAGKSQQQEKRKTPPPPPPPPKRPRADIPRDLMVPVDVRDAFAVLHLLPSAPLEVVKAAYKALALLHHPDHHPGPEAHTRMVAINRAVDTAKTWAERQAKRKSGAA